VVWVWLAFLLVGAVKAMWRKMKTRMVNSWPSVTGKIEQVDVNEPKGFLGLKTSNTPRYFAEITYSYGVGGNTYTGTNRRDFGDQDEAWDFLRDLKDKAVVVHYNPGKPRASSLSEPSLEVLLQTRTPIPPGSSRATRTIPEWIRPFLWLFVCLSLLGLVLSLYVHINALMGKQMPSIFWGLHVGIFVVWGPAVFVAQKRVGSTARKDFWKAVLKGAPVWMRYVSYAFSFYAAFGSLLFIAIAQNKGAGARPPANEWRGFSAVWMGFYFTAFAIWYAAAIQPLGPRCVNGHPLLSGQSFCPQCGQPALPPNDPTHQI
jgi:Protein of unknown function (DUF3592)